jgi:hypothetical protein
MLTGYARYDLKCEIPFTGPFWAFTHMSAAFIVNWPRGSSREGTEYPAKLRQAPYVLYFANRGAGGHLQSPDRSHTTSPGVRLDIDCWCLLVLANLHVPKTQISSSIVESAHKWHSSIFPLQRSHTRVSFPSTFYLQWC